MCFDLEDVFNEGMTLRDNRIGYLPPELEARCRLRIDYEIGERNRARAENARRSAPAARSATP
eukprot:15936714-Heterocapsa_arctica.AAC.1